LPGDDFDHRERASPLPLRVRLPLPLFRRDLCRSLHFAQILRAQKMVRAQHQGCRPKIVSAAMLPSQFHRDEIADCLNNPVYQPDEEHATARRRTRRDACPENRDGAEATVLAIEEPRQGALLVWKARDGVILPARLGRQDKANWRSLAPFGRKGLSAHWILQVFAASKWLSAMCAGAALRIFPMNFNLVRDGARNVPRSEATLFVRYRAR
jgi:hypothetical protein